VTPRLVCYAETRKRCISTAFKYKCFTEKGGEQPVRFSSLPFLFGFLPLTLALYFAAPPRWRNLVLLLTSLVFYGWGEPVYLGIMVLSILIDYTHGLLVEKYRSRDKLARWFVAESVILNLGLLGGKSLTSAGNHASGAGTAAAHRHFLFHVPDYELHH
jgi:hypothetical protein